MNDEWNCQIATILKVKCIFVFSSREQIYHFEWMGKMWSTEWFVSIYTSSASWQESKGWPEIEQENRAVAFPTGSTQLNLLYLYYVVFIQNAVRVAVTHTTVTHYLSCLLQLVYMSNNEADFILNQRLWWTKCRCTLNTCISYNTCSSICCFLTYVFLLTHRHSWDGKRVLFHCCFL